MAVPALRQIDLRIPSPISVYLKAMSAVCPFIEPAAAAGQLLGCGLTPDCQSARDIHPRLFEHLVPLIERYRIARRALPEKQQRLLVCHVVLIQMPPQLDVQTARLLAWPNLLGWSLKQLYTSKEIVLGFVRKGVAEQSTFGAAIPVAPFHAVIIRSRVAHSDHRFYPGNPAMLTAMMEADDDGQDVHGPLLGNVPDIHDPQALRDDRYFERIEQWWKKTLVSGAERG